MTPDQWQVQIQANIQDHARVVMHTEHLSDEELRSVHLEQTRDISGRRRRGEGGTVCVLPEGPQTIAYVGVRASPGRCGRRPARRPRSGRCRTA